MPVALRIVNDVSYVTKINHESHLAWQAQHLVTLVLRSARGVLFICYNHLRTLACLAQGVS